jgi:hypothetical protein
MMTFTGLFLINDPELITNMRNRLLPVWLTVVLSLSAIVAIQAFSSRVLAEDIKSDWSSPVNGVQYQYINRFGGSDWDILRWRNNNPFSVKIRFVAKLATQDFTTSEFDLNANTQTSDYNGDMAWASGERVVKVKVTRLP